MNETTEPAVAGPVEPTVRPCAWMAQHGREPVQATVSQQQADAWAQAGGDVVELYDGLTLWNAMATADARRRELQAQIDQLQARLAQAGLEQQRAAREERERSDEAKVLLQRCLDGFGAYIHGRKLARGQRDRLREDLSDFLEGRRVRTIQPERDVPAADRRDWG
jgi:hypothetical protein